MRATLGPYIRQLPNVWLVVRSKWLELLEFFRVPLRLSVDLGCAVIRLA